MAGSIEQSDGLADRKIGAKNAAFWAFLFASRRNVRTQPVVPLLMAAETDSELK